jgi:hypothetical protein
MWSCTFPLKLSLDILWLPHLLVDIQYAQWIQMGDPFSLIYTLQVSSSRIIDLNTLSTIST